MVVVSVVVGVVVVVVVVVVMAVVVVTTTTIIKHIYEDRMELICTEIPDTKVQPDQAPCCQQE